MRIKRQNKRLWGLLITMVFTALMAIFSAVAADAQKTKLSPEDEKKYQLAFESALAHYEKANMLYKKEKIDETIKELDAIIAIEFPDGTEDRDGLRLQLDTRSFLGELLLEKDPPQTDKAIKILKTGIKQAPSVSSQTYQLYMTLGHVYKQMNKTDEALAAFNKAQKINDILMKQKEAEEKVSGK
jgi:tetratricopeptide (TPR) repeat protein